MVPKSLYTNYNPNSLEAGCDEAGRGCLAGPVYAAAVILPKSFYHPLLNDSKKLTEKQRDKLKVIIETHALAWSVTSVSNDKIDKINIFQASLLAMHQAILNLSLEPELLLIDGKYFYNSYNIQHICIPKGDSKYASIAAASILAKTHRDACMKQLHRQFPHYCWNKNKGYATKMHRKMIHVNGITTYHRKTFKLEDKQLKFYFK